MESAKKELSSDIKVEKLNKFKDTDLTDICDATESTILDSRNSLNIGLKRSEPLVRDRLESYWKGVILVPERQLIVGRLDGVIASSIQLIKPGPNNQTSSFTGYIDQHFVAPWARGHGLAKSLLKMLEAEAKSCDFTLLRLQVNAQLDNAVKMYESLGYIKWGTLDKYEIIDKKMTAGNFYYKEI